MARSSDLPEPEVAFDEKLVADVQRFGWHCVLDGYPVRFGAVSVSRRTELRRTTAAMRGRVA